MIKEEDACCTGGKGTMVVLAALLLAIGMIVGAYMLAQGDYAPNVNVSNQPSNPNVYVSSVPPDHQITVSATESDKVTPDLLQIQLRVETTGTNAKIAQEDNAEVAAEMRSLLVAAGLSEDDIQTTAYSVRPDYRSRNKCDENGRNCYWDSEIVGYSAVHTFRLEVTQLDKGGDYIDAATSAGTNQTFVDDVAFTLQDETRRELQKSLLKAASAEAKAKAQNIAEGLGVSIGNPLSASESYSYQQPYYRYAGDMMMAEASSAAPTVLSPGEIDVSATVSVGYEIGG